MTHIEEIEARLEIGYEVPCGIPLAVRDVDYLLAEVKRMREALEEIAEQRLYSEYDCDFRDELDWSEGYDTCVKTARTALKGTQS